jgi:hypothetical protein
MIAGFIRNATLYYNKQDFSLPEQPDNQKTDCFRTNIISSIKNNIFFIFIGDEPVIIVI